MSVVHDHDRGAEVEELTTGAAAALFDEVSRAKLGVSGEEFLAAWERGDYSKDPRPEVAEVAALLPFAR